jgi:hypothetical protein
VSSSNIAPSTAAQQPQAAQGKVRTHIVVCASAARSAALKALALDIDPLCRVDLASALASPSWLPAPGCVLLLLMEVQSQWGDSVVLLALFARPQAGVLLTGLDGQPGWHFEVCSWPSSRHARQHAGWVAPPALARQAARP